MAPDQILQTLLNYRTMLVKFGLIITRDFHASEDIYHNLIIKAHNVSLDFESTSKLLAWCRTVVRSEAADWLKSQGRELPLAEWQILDLIDAENIKELTEPKNQIGWSEFLDDCLKRLSGESQKLVHLRYQSDHGCEEVAQTLGITLHSVYKRLSRIHIQLRECVTAKLEIGSSTGEREQ
jgi:RNA polymerase sigma factor (sigma-70 family)